MDLSVFDSEGKRLYSTYDPKKPGKDRIVSFLSGGEELLKEGSLCFVRGETVEGPFAVVSKGKGELPELFGKTAAAEISHLLLLTGDRYDKNRFFTELLNGSLSEGEIRSGALKLKIDPEKKRAVYVIEWRKPEDREMVTEVIRGLFSASRGDMVLSPDDRGVILIKSLDKDKGPEEIKGIARMIADMANTEALSSVRVSSGTAASDLSGLPSSYREACLALTVGRVFYEKESVFFYPELGVGRLIYQLPENTCDCFLHEIFGEKIPDRFDDETLKTVDTFFENSLNIAETARQLFIHRNTLVYRIEKIEKMTGLDIRTFDNALTFKLTLMVMDHLRILRSEGRKP